MILKMVTASTICSTSSNACRETAHFSTTLSYVNSQDNMINGRTVVNLAVSCSTYPQTRTRVLNLERRCFCIALRKIQSFITTLSLPLVSDSHCSLSSVLQSYITSLSSEDGRPFLGSLGMSSQQTILNVLREGRLCSLTGRCTRLKQSSNSRFCRDLRSSSALSCSSVSLVPPCSSFSSRRHWRQVRPLHSDMVRRDKSSM